MNKLRLRTKIEVLLGVSLLMATVVISVASLSRTISDTHDDIDTFIRNSNGNYWEATGSNIQSAIYDLYSSGGGKVVIPTGTFVINSTLYLPSNVWLDGQGRSKTIIVLANNSDCYLIKNQDWDGNTNIKLSNIKFDGNGDDQTYSYASGNVLHFIRCSFTVIDGCHITNSTLENIYFREGYSNTVINTEVSWAGINATLNETNFCQPEMTGIWFDSEIGSSIINCIAHDNYANSYVIEGTYRTGKHCKIVGCTSYNSFSGVWIENAENITVANNNIFNMINTGAYTGAIGGPYEPRGILEYGKNNAITGNTISGINSSGNGVGIYCMGDYTSITGNIVNKARHLIAIGSTTSYVTIMGNIIKEGHRGIDTYLADYVVIEDNIINDCSAYGIANKGMENGTISNNIITNGSTDGMFWQDVINCTVIGNIIQGYTDGIDGNADWSNTDWNIILGNNVMGCTNGILDVGANSLITNNLE